MLDRLWHTLCAWGILSDGRKVLLHMALGNKESEEDWLAMARDMVERGLRICCWVRKLRNIKAKLPSEVAN